MQRLTAGICVAFVLTVSACGTTVPQRGLTAGASSSSLGAGLGQPASGDSGAATSALPGSSSVTSEGTGTTSAGGHGTASYDGATSGRSEPGAAGGPAASAFTARGVTASTVKIGIAIATGSQNVANGFGIAGGPTLDEESVWRALVADVNRSGGVLGRKLDLTVHPVDLAKLVANPAQTYAEVCSDFRDDHKVFTALISISDPALRTCLAKMGTPLVVYDATVGSLVPAKAYDDFGGDYLYIPNGITMERLAQLFVKSLIARDFTHTWDTTNGGPGAMPVKLGLIHADNPDQNTYYAAYAKELARYGLAFADTVTYSGDVQTALAVTQSTVLKFASEGITHVFGASAFFLKDADSQHYRPRYAFIPALGAFGAANAPASQMRGALTVGWAPSIDVNAAQDPGPTPGLAHCRSVMRAAGLVATNREDEKMMASVCDAVYSFRAALNASGTPTVPGLRRGYEALGTSFRPAQTFGAFFAPKHHYGVDAVRDLAYDSSCSCLKYTR